MKTLHQKRAEALERRKLDLLTLNDLRETYQILLHDGREDYVRYHRYVVLVPGAPSDKRARFLVANDNVTVIVDASTFFTRKIAAATRDIESLEKILGGTHG